MKILQINNHYNRVGGAEVVYLNTIELLRKKKHTVYSLARAAESHDLKKDIELSIEYSNSVFNRFYSKSAVEVVSSLIKKSKPDIAHIHNIIGGVTFSILPILKKNNIPIVASIHDYRLLCPTCNFIDSENNICEKCARGNYFYCAVKNCSKDGRVRSIFVSLESYLRDLIYPYSKYINRFIYVSKFARDKFVDINPALSKKSFVLHNFTSSFNRSSVKGEYFLYLGRLAQEKGIATLLKSFSKNPSLKLKIAGEGPFRKFIEAQKTKNVEMTGYKSGAELEELIYNSSFIVIPSEWYENNPMSVIESYSFGKPVIGSAIGGIPEIVINDKTGFTFEPGNFNQLSDLLKMCDCINQDKYNMLSEGSYNFALENFSAEVYYKSMMSIYDSTINESRN